MTSPLHQLSRASKKTQPADVEIAQEMQAARPEALQNREGVNTLCSQDESLEAPSSQNRPLHLQQNDADSSQQEFGSHTNTQGAAGFSLASSSVPEEGMNVLGSQQKQTPHASELLEGDHQQACGVAFWGGSPERNGAIPSPFGLREHHQQQPPRDRHASLQERSSFSDDGGSLNAYLPHVGALTQTSCPLAGKEQRRAASSVLDPTYQQEDSLFNAASLAAASRGSNIEGNGDFGNTPFAGMLSPTADTHFPPSVIADAKNMLYNDLTLLSWLEPKPILEPPFSHQKSASEDRQVGNGFRGTAGTAPYQDPSRAYPQPFESVADGIVDGNTASWALPSSMSRAAQIASTRNLPMHHNLFTKYREDDTAEIMDIDSIDSTILPTDSKAMHIGAHMASNHNSNESSTGSSDSNGPQVGHFPTHQPSSHVCYNSSFSSSYSRADQLVEAQDDAPGDQAAKFLESLADERQWATEPQKDNGQDLGIHDPVHEFANSSTLANAAAPATSALSLPEAEDLEGSDEEESQDVRFCTHQADRWAKSYEELKQHRKMHGNCLVPNAFAENPKLAKWVKRQRYQYKLKQNKSHSTLSDARQNKLEDLGFVWGTQNALWFEKYEALKRYRAKHGDCLVPSNYPDDPPLSVWVKYQRRQLKRFRMGKQSSMTEERFEHLEQLNFEWNPRNLE